MEKEEGKCARCTRQLHFIAGASREGEMAEKGARSLGVLGPQSWGKVPWFTQSWTKRVALGKKPWGLGSDTGPARGWAGVSFLCWLKERP